MAVLMKREKFLKENFCDKGNYFEKILNKKGNFLRSIFNEKGNFLRQS